MFRTFYVYDLVDAVLFEGTAVPCGDKHELGIRT